MGRRVAVAAAAGLALAVAGVASGGLSAGDVVVPAGKWADFPTSNGPWRCSNARVRVECASGDAYPYVDLTATARGGLAVVVHVLGNPAGPGPTVSRDRYGNRIYTFPANR